MEVHLRGPCPARGHEKKMQRLIAESAFQTHTFFETSWQSKKGDVDLRLSSSSKTSTKASPLAAVGCRSSTQDVRNPRYLTTMVDLSCLTPRSVARPAVLRKENTVVVSCDSSYTKRATGQ
ncbi:hypothetical protein CHS0354_024424 [Potamilus streckersoni]|uniref:Uncharacterized protein n=1 Tax=Potamilus streckersoni TaxID=2493646 RepID=A0AAE0SVQ2_9BIVA|nr:hypothetical protein CHS0354_024424 [Potamilus streckersoni]